MSRDGEPATDEGSDRAPGVPAPVSGAATPPVGAADVPFFDQPAIRDRLFSIPEVRSRLLDLPDVRSSLLALPRVEQEVFDRPEVVARIMRDDVARRRLLDDDEVRTAILALHPVRARLLADHHVEDVVFDDPELVNRLFSDPDVRRMVMGLPRVRQRLIEDDELRDAILANEEVRAAIVQYGLAPTSAVTLPPSTRDAPAPSMGASDAGMSSAAPTATVETVPTVEVARRPDELDVEPPARREVTEEERRPSRGARPGGVALTLALVGIAMGVVPVLFPGALLLGVVAAIAALAGRSRARRWHRGQGLASAGLLLSAVAIILGVVGLLITGDAINTFDDTIDEVSDWLQDVDQDLSAELS